MRARLGFRTVWSAAMAVAALTAGAGAAEPTFSPAQLEFFEKKIRPVLVQHCAECHAEKEAEAGFRVDSRAALLTGGESGTALVPGNPDQSRLIQAIRYNGRLLMPPDKKLPQEAVDDLVKWVKDGAAWPAEAAKVAGPAAGGPSAPENIAAARQSHWAFKPVVEPPLPAVKQSAWPANEVDRFVLEKLEAHGRTPSPEADRRTLLRRLKYDLHGLPPTYEEVRAFEQDASPDAFAKLVERLLAAPEYGQRWARHWLDIARYADTKGYVFQEERRYPYAYTYRDYVVDAFNDDKPYDRFVVEQLAADRLELGEDKSALAALGFLTVGRRFLNNIHDIIDDRIDVVSRGLQGLTVSCARCHDHKFDPIPTADYYSLYGVFASSEEPKDLPLLGEPEKTPRFLAFRKELEKREAAAAAYRQEKLDLHLDRNRRLVGQYLLAVVDSDKKNAGEQRTLATDRKLHQRTVERWQRRLAQVDPKTDGILGPWKRLTSVPPEKFAAEAEAFFKEAADPAAKNAPLHPRLRQAFEPRPTDRADLAKRYDTVFAAVADAWKAALAAKPPQDKLADADLESLRKFIHTDNSPAGIKPEEFETFLGRDERNKYRELLRKIDQHRAGSPDAPPRGMVLVDKAQPFEPRIFRRGNQGSQGDIVPRRYLAVLEADRKPFTKGSGRLELAEKIASRDNPLTARVFVNRVWMHHFGQGLVITPSDFGVRCEPPSHPALLDFLAAKFMADGWSVKQLHRRIVLSKTYRQTSDLRPGDRDTDPDNRLLSHMGRRRLDFESMRDSLLAAAGRLDTTVGGRPVDIFTRPFATRRTLYAFIDRQNLEGLFRTFDLASPDASTPQRFTTTVPQQALFLMNSPFVLEQARHLVKRAETAGGEVPSAKIVEMYRATLARDPRPEEIELGLRFTAGPPPTGLAETDFEDPWQYGWGQVDEEAKKTVSFTGFVHFTGTQWQAGPNLPDGKVGWASLTAAGGHPGNPQHQAIRRWIAPRTGTIVVEGKLKHPSDQGDGVRGRLISDRTGRAGEWIARKGETPTKIEKLEVEAGEVLDFVVDCRENESHDSFEWAPTVRMVPASGPAAPGDKLVWKAAEDFGRSKPDDLGSLGPWERYAQVLLLTNEFMFVD